ncbi:MAG: ABC transporter substrate-binding protein, partial [Candidatus Nanopelagicales bacterium]|nr:ABC transporter substrate-binding protein [Candidatus Nanopelagicales bacterium]MCF8543124.1 ABC transporter substrate-binding protein [Candidatus Nanopelagicales bacterium]
MRRSLFVGSLVVSAALVLSACSSSDSGSETTESSTAASASESAASEAPATEETVAAAGDAVCGTTVEEIAAAAAAEGQVNLIALPDTWANYKGILDSFKATYGIDAPVANPDASSADELTAVQTLAGQPDMPDALDIGPSFVQQGIDEGLITSYKTTNWDEIPDALKGPNGEWVGSYYGIMAIATNTTLVPEAPTSFADLLKPEYKGMVTLNGDPREAGAAFAAVVAASLANGGSYDDLMPGIEYFAELKKAGNLQTIDVTEAALLSGEVPIALDWTYNFPGIQAQLAEVGFNMDVVVPSDGLYGSYYAQMPVMDSPHPCAAQLWMEHITGDQGALGYLEGGAIPARFAAMKAAGVIPADMLDKLPTEEQIAQISFPSAEQVESMKTQLTENWG